jgi:hypothetical protein
MAKMAERTGEDGLEQDVMGTTLSMASKGITPKSKSNKWKVLQEEHKKRQTVAMFTAALEGENGTSLTPEQGGATQTPSVAAATAPAMAKGIIPKSKSNKWKVLQDAHKKRQALAMLTGAHGEDGLEQDVAATTPTMAMKVVSSIPKQDAVSTTPSIAAKGITPKSKSNKWKVLQEAQKKRHVVAMLTGENGSKPMLEQVEVPRRERGDAVATEPTTATKGIIPKSKKLKMLREASMAGMPVDVTATEPMPQRSGRELPQSPDMVATPSAKIHKKKKVLASIAD